MTLGPAGSRSVEAAAHNWAAGSLRLPGLVLLPRSAAGGRRGDEGRTARFLRCPGDVCWRGPLATCCRMKVPSSRTIDTVKLARRKFPGAPASLDALCRRFGVDLSGRQKHGALLDSALLAEVYLELIGGRQPGLVLTALALRPSVAYAPRPARRHAASAAELAAHAAFVATLTEPIWNRAEPGSG